MRVGARLAIDAKGTREPIVVYDLRAVGEEALPDAAEEAVPLPDAIRALCHVVEGKRVDAEAFGAEVIELSSHGATVLSPRRLRPLSNLKLEFRPAGQDPVEIYAKVVSVAPGGSVTVRFTSLPAKVEGWLREVLEGVREAR